MNFITTDIIPEMTGGWLFNAPEFHALKAGRRVCYGLEDNGSVIARIVFYLNREHAFSGHQAPFGSFDFARKLEKKTLENFIGDITRDLAKQGIHHILIKCPADYNFFNEQVVTCLEEQDFQSTMVELNQHLIVDRIAFAQRIKQKERNKLNRAIKEGFQFRRLKKIDISAVYQLVKLAYGRKNYPVSMDEQDLLRAFDKMPDRYKLFGLYDGTILIAVIASVLVSNDVMYNFYHADLASYRSRSPLVMLIGETYRYCQEQKIKILDLGISTVNGVRNEGLYRFKENLGCSMSEKKTLELSRMP